MRKLLRSLNRKYFGRDGLRRVSIGLRAAERHAILARFDGAHTFVVDLGKRPRVEVEGNVPCFAGAEVQALKSGESEVRRYCGMRGREISSDFIASHHARIRDVGFHGELIAGMQGFGRQTKMGIGEGGVTQAIAEAIKRLALEVAVSAIGHGVVVEGR